MVCRLVAGLLLCAAASAAAEGPSVYRWVDEKGVIHYTDQPPSKNAKPARLPPLQTYREAPAAKSAAPVAPAAAAPVQIQIVAPQPDQTFRGGERELTVSVALTPPVLGELRLVYYLDGQAVTPAPVAATSLTLRDVERGSHSVAVAVVDAGGRERARSGAVSFHMKPPVAGQRRP